MAPCLACTPAAKTSSPSVAPSSASPVTAAPRADELWSGTVTMRGPVVPNSWTKEVALSGRTVKVRTSGGGSASPSMATRQLSEADVAQLNKLLGELKPPGAGPNTGGPLNALNLRSESGRQITVADSVGNNFTVIEKIYVLLAGS